MLGAHLIQLPKAKIPNPAFRETLTRLLGNDWNISEVGENWELSLISGKFQTQYITNIATEDLVENKVLESVTAALGRTENKDEHQRFLQAGGIQDFHHNVYENYGIIAWLLAGRAMFGLTPMDQFAQDDGKFFQELWEKFNIRQAIAYRKNIFPFFALLTIRKYAYLLPTELSFLEIQKNHFGGSIPSANDFSTYIDPFLVFSPITTSIPLDRPTSGVLLIPEQSFITPFEANVGWAEVLITAQNGSSQMGTFELFDSRNSIPKIFIATYADALLNGLNSFVQWLFDPATSSDNEGRYNAGFGLQVLATTNAIFNSFAYCARYIDSNVKMLHTFSALDQISNLATNSFYLKKGRVGDDTVSLEAKLFIKLFSEEFFKKSLTFMKTNLSGNQVAELIESAGLAVYADLKQSLKPFKGEIGEILRSVRNTAHGAFLRNDKFLKTFSQGELKISPRLSILLYIYMLCLLLSPDIFIQELTTDI